MLLREVHEAIHDGETFGLESTISGLTYIRLLRNAQRRGHVVKLFYLWLPSPEVAVCRVRERVRKGGHDVPATDVCRRFDRSLTNLARHYLPIADEWSILDNSGTPSRLIAAGTTEHVTVVDEQLFAAITSRRT